MGNTWKAFDDANWAICECRKDLCASQVAPSVVHTPVLPFWKNVPENMLGLPLNSGFDMASLISLYELRTTRGLVPTMMLNIEPYFSDRRRKLRPTFRESKKGK